MAAALIRLELRETRSPSDNPDVTWLPLDSSAASGTSDFPLSKFSRAIGMARLARARMPSMRASGFQGSNDSRKPKNGLRAPPCSKLIQLGIGSGHD